MSRLVLEESFQKQALNPALRWQNAPREWFVDEAAARLVVVPEAETDFWQRTHYGFRADNGHFLYAEVEGDFRMTTRVEFHPRNQYDQAGLMVRFSDQVWLKTSVECELEGPSKLGVVATRGGYSDWSLQDFPGECDVVELQVSRHAEDFLVEYRLEDTSDWELMRVAHLDAAAGEPARCGLYACSPKGAGFRAEFARLWIAQEP